MSKEATGAKVVHLTGKPKGKKGRNDNGPTGTSGVSPRSPNLAPQDPPSSGEHEIDVVRHLGREEGSLEEPDSGLKESPLLPGPFA